MNCLKNEYGKVVVEPDEVKQRWKDYLKRLVNIENDWNGFDVEDVCEEPQNLIAVAKVLTAIGRLKCNKAGGPSGLVGDILRLLNILSIDQCAKERYPRELLLR